MPKEIKFMLYVSCFKEQKENENLFLKAQKEQKKKVKHEKITLTLIFCGA